MRKIFTLLFAIVVCSSYSQSKISELEEQLKTAKEKDKAEIFNSLGKEYCFKGNFDYARNYFFQALNLNEEMRNKKGVSKTLNNIGVIYLYQGNYKASLEYYEKSLAIDKDIDNTEGLAHTLNNIGLIHFYLDNMGKALQYYKQSYEFYEELGNKQEMANALFQIGQTYYQSDQLEDAENQFNKSLILYREANDNLGLAKVYNYMAQLNSEEDDLEKSKEYFENALEFCSKTPDNALKTRILTAYAKLLVKEKKYDNALVSLLESNEIAQKYDFKNLLLSNYQLSAEIYENKNDYKKSLEYFKLYTALKENLNLEESTIQAIELQNRYSIEKKQIELQLMKKEKEVYELQFRVDSLKKVNN